MFLEAGDPTRIALEKIADILQRKAKIPKLVTNTPLTPKAPQTDIALSRVKTNRMKTKVSFNPSRNIIYPIEHINPTLPSESMQVPVIAAAAHVLHQDHASLPRADKGKIGIEIN